MNYDDGDLDDGNSDLTQGDPGGGNNEPTGLNEAMNAVEAAFAFGRQKHGINTNKQASALPASPGTQTAPGALPMPGPLPPTSTPFGKRNTPYPAGKVAEADIDGDSDMAPGTDGAAGIPTEEDEG